MGKKEASKTVKKIASTVAKGAEAGTERALVVAKGAAEEIISNVIEIHDSEVS